jgi:hypothetical protein
MAANIIQTMKQAVKAQVLAAKTLHALGATGAEESDAEDARAEVIRATLHRSRDDFGAPAAA